MFKSFLKFILGVLLFSEYNGERSSESLGDLSDLNTNRIKMSFLKFRLILYKFNSLLHVTLLHQIWKKIYRGLEYLHEYRDLLRSTPLESSNDVSELFFNREICVFFVFYLIFLHCILEIQDVMVLEWRKIVMKMS